GHAVAGDDAALGIGPVFDLLLRRAPEDGGVDQEPPLTLPHLAPVLLPRPVAHAVAGRRALELDEEGVLDGVVAEVGAEAEVGGERAGVLADAREPAREHGAGLG